MFWLSRTSSAERAPAEAYLFPLVVDAGVLRPAAEGDGTFRALAGAIAEGRTIPALPSIPEGAAEPAQAGPVTAALVCRPASGLRDLAPGGASSVHGLAERPLGTDQSNTSVVLGERLLLKAYRWLQPGLNPDLELVAYLTEEAGFTAVPPLAGYAEVVSRSSEPATVALLQAFVADAADAYESLAETLTDWLLAPGSVSVEFATEIAADIGALSAGLHGALAVGARRSRLRAAAGDPRRAARLARGCAHAAGPGARRHARRGGACAAGARAEDRRGADDLRGAPDRAARHARPRRLPPGPGARGPRRVPDRGLRGGADARPRGAARPPVAAARRGVDAAVVRSRGAERRTARRGTQRRPRAEIPVSIWRLGCAAPASGSSRPTGPGCDRRARRSRSTRRCVRAFEIEKECYEFVYAATYLPEWLWAPTEGMRALMATS